MKSNIKKRGLSIAALAMIAIFAVSSALSFVSVYATDDVSPTDSVSGDVITEKAASSEVASEKDEQPPVGAVKTVSIKREAPDFLLSSMAGRERGNTRFYKFLPSASYNGSYRSELDDNEKKLYDGLYNTFVVGKKNYTEVVHVDINPAIPFDVVYSDAENDVLSIDDLGDVEDAILSAAAAFFYDCPEAFWIRGFNYIVDADLTTGKDIGKGYVDWVEFTFDHASYPNAYGDLSSFETGLASAVASIRNSRVNESVYETVKAIHDYIIYNASYNYDALSGSTYTYGYAYSAAPLFVSRLKGKFVCEGYSKAMKILCNEFDINCALVSGEGKTSDTSGGPHMWCYVQIGDNWYASDTTWDDGYGYMDGTPCPMYTYFLVGSSTTVRDNKTFAQTHINDGQVMTTPTKFSLVFPPLSESSYDHYILDTDPFVTLTTLGASIRVSDPFGIRYGIQILKDDGLRRAGHVFDFGTLMIPSDKLGDNELTISTPNVLKIRAKNIYSQDDEQVTYTGVLINIPKSFFNTNIKGRGYLIYIDQDTGEEHIVYSEVAERSFYGVAEAAYDLYSRIEHPDDKQKNILNKLKAILEAR